MTDTTTPVLGLVKQTIGANRNTWGGIINACWDLVEAAIYGQTSKVVTGAGDVTLTSTERRARILNFTGTLVADQTIIVSNLVGRWTVRNGTSGAFALKFKTSAGTAVTVPQSGNCNVWCDGNDVMYADLSTRLRDTQMLAPDGALSAPGFGFLSEIATGLRRSAANTIAVTVNGIDILTITGSAMTLITGALAVPSLTVNGAVVPPIGTVLDYDGIELPAGYVWRNGGAYSRTTYALLFAATTKTATGNTHGTTTIDNISTDLRFRGLLGAYIEGTGVPLGTTVTAISLTALTLSAAVSGSGTGVSLRLLPAGPGDGSTTFNVKDGRDRTKVGRADMGGPDAGRLTTYDGTRLKTTGGSDTITITQGNLPNVTLPNTLAAATTTTTTTTTTTSTTTTANNTDYVDDSTAALQSGPANNFGRANNLTQQTFTSISISASNSSSDSTTSLSGSVTTGGSGTAIDNMMPFDICNQIIYAGV